MPGANITPISRAQNGTLRLVREMLQCGEIDLNSRDRFERTLLHTTSYQNEASVVRFLINKRADPHANDCWRETALHIAAYSGHEEIVRDLVEANSRLDARDRSGYTPLHAAAKGKNQAVVRYLIKKNAALEACNQEGRTPLHIATLFGRMSNTHVLMICQANVDAVDMYGETPLHKAAIFGEGLIAEQLLQHGANMRAVDNAGKTARDLASRHHAYAPIREGRIRIVSAIDRFELMQTLNAVGDVFENIYPDIKQTLAQILYGDDMGNAWRKTRDAQACHSLPRRNMAVGLCLPPPQKSADRRSPS